MKILCLHCYTITYCCKKPQRKIIKIKSFILDRCDTIRRQNKQTYERKRRHTPPNPYLCLRNLEKYDFPRGLNGREFRPDRNHWMNWLFYTTRTGVSRRLWSSALWDVEGKVRRTLWMRTLGRRYDNPSGSPVPSPGLSLLRLWMYKTKPISEVISMIFCVWCC